MLTKLEARVKDLKLVKDSDGKVTHWSFRLGHCESFHDTLAEFKARIPVQAREPMPEDGWRWLVEASSARRNVLGEIFQNFEFSVSTAEAQMELWGAEQ